jgi:sortase (surface protein transpeptidase)
MSIFRILFELFVLYLLYKVIFDFIIPIYQTTKQVKQKVGEMQQKMNEHQRQEKPSFNTFNKEKAKPTSNKNDDYIEYEEVK